MATILSWVFQRVLGSFLRPGVTVDVPLSDDLLARVSVLETVAAMPAGGAGSRLHGVLYETLDECPLPIAAAVQERVTRAMPYMTPCPQCAHLTDRGYVFLPINPARYHGIVRIRQRMTAAPSNWSDHPMHPRMWDTLGLILPYMCHHGMAQLRACPDGRCQTFTRFPGVRAGARTRAVLVDDPGLHRPGCPGFDATPEPTVGWDSFGPIQSGWGKDRRLNHEFACPACRSDQFCALDPNILTLQHNFELVAVNDGFLRSMMWARAAWELAGSPRQVQVTAWSRDYCLVEHITQFLPFCVVLVNTLEEYDAVQARGLVPITCPRVGPDGRSGGNWRLWLAESFPVGVVVAVTNAVNHAGIVMSLAMPMTAPVETCSISLTSPIAHFLLMVAGATRMHLTMPTSAAMAFIHCYGLEERVLAVGTNWVVRADHHIRGLDPIKNFHASYYRPHPLILKMPSGHYVVARYTGRYVTLAAVRQAIAVSHGATERPSWRDMLAMPLGDIKPDDEEPDLEVLSKGAPPTRSRVATAATVTQALAADIGPINWVVFGSHGDIVPVRAIARHLRRWGFTINVICPHSREEGISMLADAETGNILHSAPIYARGIAMAASLGGFVIGPPEFSSVDLGVSLRPPYGIIRPVDFSIGIIGNFILDRGLRGWAPIVNIGAYSGTHWLPRSSNGRTFLKKSTNTDRPIDIMIAWGSSTLPPPAIVNAVFVKPGDHYSQFEKVKVLVTHGGAGTVQTGGAAGCRVIAGTKVLDRGYIDLTNAAAGITLGVDPDRSVLMFVTTHPRVFIWAWKHSYTMFAQAVLWWAWWTLPGATWLLVALFYNSVMFVVRFPSFRVVMSTNFLATLIASAAYPYAGKMVAATLSPGAAQVITYVIDVMGYSNTEVLLSLFKTLATMSRSSVVWVLLLRGWGWFALLGAAAFSALRVVSTIVAEGASVVLVPSASNSDTPMTQVGISWAFQGSIVPVFHTRFLCPEVGEKVEGIWSSNLKGMGCLYTIGKRPWVDEGTGEWRFPTSIPWSAFDGIQDCTAPYSPAWNCQSAMLHVVRGFWMSLGLSVVVLVPSIMWMYGSLFILLVWTSLALIFIEILPIVTLCLFVTGQSWRTPYIHATAYNVFSMLVNTRNGVPSAATAIVNGFINGWGQTYDNTSAARVASVFRTNDVSVLGRLVVAGVEDGDDFLVSLAGLKRDMILYRERHLALRMIGPM